MEQISLFDLPEFSKNTNQVTILLSLQNEYFLKMISGTKKYEYRFAFPKANVKAFIYAPRKVKAVVGCVDFEFPIEGSATEISKLYSECGDGDYQVMFDYIGKRKKAYAMKVKRVTKFEKPLSYAMIKKHFPSFCAPQSYIILDKNQELLEFIQSKSFDITEDFSIEKKIDEMSKKPTIYYSVGGMAQYYETPLDVLAFGIVPNIKKIVINTSVQPNDIPHFGTITTFMGAFILAQKSKERFQRDATVEIDFVDCGPTADYHQNGGVMCLSIARSLHDEDTKLSSADYFISNYYIPLLDWIKEKTSVNYSIRRYKDFQLEHSVRKTVVEICQNKQLERILSPVNSKLHIRAECPFCGYIDKQMKNTYITTPSANCFVIHSYCAEHGPYEVEISENNNNYFEANTQIRDIAKGALMQYYRHKQMLGVMYDGGDWGGAWTHHVHCMALQQLGYQIPIRLFAPLILDWSGGKLSKSIYRENADCAVDAIENYECFVKCHGEQGLSIVFREVCDWLSSSKKFFRNYSLDYILSLLKS